MGDIEIQGTPVPGQTTASRLVIGASTGANPAVVIAIGEARVALDGDAALRVVRALEDAIVAGNVARIDGVTPTGARRPYRGVEVSHVEIAGDIAIRISVGDPLTVATRPLASLYLTPTAATTAVVAIRAVRAELGIDGRGVA